MKEDTDRPPALDRRGQILEATLRLLADTPIEALTTRELAAELGVTQPALFRHFSSREAIFVEVVEHARGELEAIASRVLARGGRATEVLRALGDALLTHAEAAPGLPRLLFASATAKPGRVREALRAVVGMQAALAAELVRQGQGEGDVAASIDPAHAATLFVGAIQGLVLRWEIGGRSEPLAAGFAPLFDLWLHGVASRPRAASSSAASAAAPRGEGAAAIVKLDVRPILARGVDPLTAILAVIDALPPAGVLSIEAPFRPSPLLALLARKGHAATCEGLARDHFVVDVVKGGAPAIEDLRDLAAPEPMERVLVAGAALAPGEVFVALLPRFPRLLVPRLDERGLSHAIEERADGAAILRLTRPA